MADYRILVGTELKTDGINTALNNYKGKVKVGATLDTGDITKAISGYKAKAINVDTKLNTDGITSAIRGYVPPKKIHLESELSTVGIDQKINNYTPKSPIKVDVELTKSSINQQIRDYKPSESIKINAKLDNNAITEAIRSYKAAAPIKIKVDPDFSEAGAKISNYQMRNMLKVNVKLNKTFIDKQIQNFQTSSKIEVGAKLRENAIETAIRKYAGKELVPITIDFKVGDTKEVTNKINEYKNTPVTISARIQPSKTGFDSAVTKKTVTVGAELKADGINSAIESFKPTSKIKVGVKLDSKDVNGQLKKLPKPTDPIDVDVRLNDASVNSAIAKVSPTSRIKAGVRLNTDDINKQIEAIHPTSRVNVRVKLDNNNIDEKTGKQDIQEPVLVNVKLNTEKINEQITAFKTQSKISVGVKLDFASHKGGQVGIPQQIKDYKTSAKLKVGVQLDKDDIVQQIGQVKADSPIKLGVELDPDGIQRVQKQVDSFREQIKALGNVKINLGGNRATVTGGTSGKGGAAGTGIQQGFVEADIKITDMANHIKSLQSALKTLGFNKSSIDAITSEFKELDVIVKNVTTRLDRNGNLSLTIKGLDEVGRTVSMIKGVDAKGNLTSLGTSISQSFKETEASFARLKAVASQMKSLKVQIAGLDSDKNKNKIAELTSQLQKLQSEYRDLYLITQQNLNTSQLDELKRKSIETGNAVRVAKASMADKSAYDKEQAEIRETRDEYQRLIKIANSMKRIKVTLVGLDAEKDKQRIAELTSQLNNLNSTYATLYASKKGDFNTKQLDALKQKSIETVDAVNDAKAAMADNTANFANGIRNSFSDYDAKVKTLKDKIMGLSQPTKEVVGALANVEQALVDMNKASSNDELIAAEERYQAALEETEAQLKINQLLESQPNANGVANDFAIKKEAALIRIKNLFENGSQAAKRFGAEARKLTRELNSVGNEAGIDRVINKVSNLEKKVKMSNLQTKTFGTRLKDQFAKYSQYLSIASVFMYAAQAARSMFEQVKLIDSAMTELKKVTDETDAAYDQFLSNAASKAKEIGTTIDGLVSSTADFARLGYGFEDAQGLAEVANIYAVVGDEIEGVEGATESLVSTMAAFKDETSDISATDFAMDIVDKFNEIGNNFAISSGGIGEAMERSASSMKAANNTIDETIALITAANTVVQNPDAVGTAFKTISMRIRGAKTELSEAGLETEGMVESTAKLRQEIMALSGVDIMESDGQTFKSTYAILDELALKWKDLSDIQQATITELIAGKRQGNIISSLMNNFQTARDALETSLKSSGSAMKEHEKWQKSLEARINSLKASWQSLSQTFMSSKLLKWGMGLITGLIDGIDNLIDHFGVLGTVIGSIGLYKKFKSGFAIDENGNQIGKYAGMFKGLGETLKTDIGLMKTAASQSGTLGEKLRRVGSVGKQTGKHIGNSFKASSESIKAMIKDIGTMLVVMGAIKAISDIATWISEAGEEAETAAEKFDKISEELSGVESELSGLESELSSVESQIDTLLAKDELTFADEEELSRLRQVSAELEHQIQLTETLQKSLQKSLNSAALSAYSDYASDTSFYSNESRSDRIEANKTKGSAIGNIVGLIAGGVIAYLTGGTSLILAGAGIGSALGSAGGSFAGGNLAKTSYDNETTVREVLDNMGAERFRLEKARDEAYEAYVGDKYNDKKIEAWQEAEAALSDYNTALSNHMTQLSEYYNSIDYNSLESKEDKENYLKMGDDLDKYNITMGVVGAKSTAFDRIFSDELVTKEARELRGAIEAALNSGEEIKLEDFNGEQFVGIKERFADIGVTINDCISYFEDLQEAQEEASNYETYDMVSNIAALSDGVTALTDAFAEFNEKGTVSSKTLAELHEVFGTLGEDWVNYVDVMTNGIATIEDAREATEQLVESYTGNLLKNGGIKFAKFNEETDRYEFNEDGYKTYLSTINQLEDLGVENAKEYLDAAQQQAMIRDAASQMMRDSAQREALLAKETLTEQEKTYLATLKGKELDDYRLEIESKYGIRFKDSGLIQKQYNLNEYQAKSREYQKYLNDIDGLSTDFEDSLTASEKYWNDQKELQKQWEPYVEDGYGTSGGSWKEAGSAFGEAIETAFGSWLGFDIDTEYDKFEKIDKEYETAIDMAENESAKREEFFKELVDIAEKSDIDLSDIDVDGFNSALTDDEKSNIFNQVYERVKTELNSSIDEYEENIKGLESEIEARLNNLGLEIDFGRNFDKIIIDGLKGKIEKFNTAQSEMFSSGGLSTDSIIAMDEIFGDLSGYNSSELFENTANGVRLNTEAFEKYSEQFKKVNIGAIEGKMDELGKTYEETREELNKLTYGTIEYQEKARELEGVGKQIEANEELLSQYKALFSSYQEWQRAEAAGSERNMYETVLGGFESVGDEISRGWVDEGTREFFELLKGEKATIIDGNGNKKEIDIATASVQDLKKVWKGLDKDIEHTTHSVRDFFTVDEEGNSTSQGVYNFLDAIGQMEEEKFGSKDVVKRNSKGNIIGFDFQMVGGDEAIAEALGVSEELVQIMKRAAIDAGFVVTFDGSFEQLDVLKEKAESAAVEMNKILKADGKATIDIDMNADSVEEIQPQIDKIMETFGKKDANGKLTGEIDMGINGADKAIGIARTLQSMLDKITRPAYMDIQAGQVEEELRTPLSKLQELRTYIEQEHQLKLSGGDTSKLEASKQEIYDYFEKLDPKIKAQIGLVDANGNGITEDSFNKLTGEQKIELGYVDENGKPIEDFSEALKKKLGDGSLSIAATVDLQLEMADALDVLAQTALFEQGKISEEEYTKRIQVYLDAEVEDDKAKDEVDGAVDEVTNGETREKNIKIVAETFGVKDVESLKTAMSGLTDEQVKAIAEAIGKGDVDALDSAVEGMDGNVVKAIAQALGYDDVESLKSAVKNMQGNEVDAKVNTDGQVAKIDALQSSIFGLDGTTVDVIVNFVKSGWNAVKNWITGGGDEGGGGVNGTANSSGSSFASGTIGRAFVRGDWRTKKSEKALVGELGREIVVTPQNRWYTVGDWGAEFTNIPKGSIIFNHRQTEELLKNGKVTSGGGRAKAFVNGTAFIGGTAHRGDAEGGMSLPDEIVVSTNSNTGKTYKKSKDSKDFEETIDLIEIALKRVQREIDNLDQKANNVYKSWGSRNAALSKEISKVGNEINLQQKAYNEYIAAANGVGLSSSWAAKVRNGEVDIETIKDETLADKIKDYQSYYEKALDCKDAIEELKEAESKLYAQRFENVQTQYDGILQGYEHTEAMLNEYISQAEAQGHIVSTKYYNALIENEKQNINTLKQEQAALIAERDKAVADGKITKYSEEWYNMCQEIDGVTQAIEEGTTALIEYNNAIRDIEWEKFDLAQERISDIAAESEFLIELMSNKDLFDDNGKLTEQGAATMGLHALNYNTSMYQSDDYGKEIAKLDKQIAKDPYDKELINRRRELVELQRESILEAENQKNAIKDLVEDGINLELDALQERIDLHNEELDSMKDLYDYQKDVEEQTKNIASLRKQLGAYEGFNDEETRAKVQELKVSLEEAEADLKETEYDKFISDQTALLDTLYTEYETILNSRLDNIDFLLQQVIDGINIAAGEGGTLTSALGSEGAIAMAIVSAVGENGTVKGILNTELGAVGTTLSNAMNSIWSVGEGNAKSVLTTYGTNFQTQQTTTNQTLNGIKASVDKMANASDKDAKKKTEAPKTQPSTKADPTKDTKPTTKPVTNNNKNKSTGDGKAKVGDKVKFVSGQYYYDSQGKKPIGSKNRGKEVYITSINTKSWATHPYHISTGKKLGSGDLGWLKLNQLSGYAAGNKKISNSQYAWTQENGQEYIVRPSDGAILTPIAKGDSVLNAAASGNIWNMANNPTEFIKSNLGLDAANVPNGANVQSNYTQHLDKVIFNLPNVKNYDELLAAMQKDKNFERLILSMSIDRIAGKSGLAKGKSIR